MGLASKQARRPYNISMSDRNYRVAVIGRTGRGNYGHGLDVVWKQFPNTKIVAVADENPEGLKKAGERLGVQALYSDHQKMLRQERPDIVSIAMRWTDCHHDMVLAAAEARASIYLEKPMARTPAEADSMIRACDAAHVKLAVAYQMRVCPILDLAREKLAAGAIAGAGRAAARAGSRNARHRPLPQSRRAGAQGDEEGRRVSTPFHR